MQSLDLLAKAQNAVHVAPLGDPRFVAALAAQQGWRMFESRTAAMSALVGDLLPHEVCSRSSKAYFDTAFFHRHARAFAAEWDGTGLDPEFVDLERLRHTWLHDDEPDARTYSLLQDAWLAARTT
jgi:asparagine synthase (glutamine-hydrolysing)